MNERRAHFAGIKYQRRESPYGGDLQNADDAVPK